MAKNLEISYLEHSGFTVETQNNILVFDYYKDPAMCMHTLMLSQKKKWIFSSHQHYDHFVQGINQWKNEVEAYFLSSDIKSVGGLTEVENKKIIYMNPYETKNHDELKVTTYGSTDEGVSFLVEADGLKIFHAGDLNWWHWKGDTAENQTAAADYFQKEITRLDGLKVDIAFFPVDSRLEECRTMGVLEFCKHVQVSQLIAMHACGEPWLPPVDFPGVNNGLAIWCPKIPGEKLRI